MASANHRKFQVLGPVLNCAINQNNCSIIRGRLRCYFTIFYHWVGPGCQAEMINLYLFCDKFVKELNKDWFRNMFFLVATAALEVKMLVCLCPYVCHTCYSWLHGLQGLQNLLKSQPSGLQDLLYLIKIISSGHPHCICFWQCWRNQQCYHWQHQLHLHLLLQHCHTLHLPPADLLHPVIITLHCFSIISPHFYPFIKFVDSVHF